MTEQFEHDAQDYLLNRMDAVRRTAFEQELDNDPAARAALKACADALAGFACEVAQPEPLSAADQRATLETILATVRTPEARRPARSGGIKLRWLWPVAAALLLGLNLVEFHRPFAPTFERESGMATVDSRKKGNDQGLPGGKSPATAGGAIDGQEKGGTTTETTRQAALAAEAREHELERLRAGLADLQRTRDRLRAENSALLDRLAGMNLANRDLNRLSTMELVDGGSFARGERRGLVNIGRGILTEPGVVTVTDPVPPPTSTGSATPTPKLPYAWSVFDEKDERGYLNLYNLPPVPEEQTMQAWVRPPDSREYQRVGEVPQQFYGGNGSLQYQLPDGTTTPAEILITIEPRGITPVRPTGPTVLRGP